MKGKGRSWRKKPDKNLNPLKEAVEPSEEMSNALSDRLQDNLDILKKVFKGCSDVVFREMHISHQLDGLLVFVDGIVKSDVLQDNTLRPLLLQMTDSQEHNRITPDDIEKDTLTISQLARVDKLSEIVDAILAGNAALFLDGYKEALILNVRGGERRGVEEPATEAVIRGPREGFTENIRTNTGLLRFKIKSPRLKTESFTIGEHTRTNVVLSYIAGIADPKVIEEVESRLQSIHIDGVLESGYIEEFIEDQPLSPFPQLHYTERPDSVAAQLLEGKFAIIVDGTPFVMTGPVTFWQFLQASEDYYERFVIATLIRWLRFLFLFIALFLPALYVATITFHQDMLPTTLALSIAAAREAIPFPALLEALIMEVAFEALREAGIRLPKTIGQAVSILGALVIGTAAVEAGIVSAPMVIIVSLTGIASFTIPRFNMAISVRMLRFPLMIFAGFFGLFGIIIGTVWIAVHLCHLRSFGVPYMSGIAPLQRDELKDIFVRVPWWKMVLRPTSIIHRNRKRMKDGMKPRPPSPETRPEG
jgi:spore germination protein